MARKRERIKGGFVALTWDLLNSRAYKSLPPSAAKALPFFLGKVHAWSPSDPTRYTTDFAFTYAEANKLGFGKSTFRKMLKELMKHGFINMTYHGHYRTSGPQASSTFRLSRRWERFGELCFDEGDWKKHFPERQGKEKSQVPKVNLISPKSEPTLTREGVL
ncbi:MAG: hypothetical protein ABSC19_12555 [Syntrophorhabdales bacterium]|jgi:hypothetical protein